MMSRLSPYVSTQYVQRPHLMTEQVSENPVPSGSSRQSTCMSGGRFAGADAAGTRTTVGIANTAASVAVASVAVASVASVAVASVAASGPSAGPGLASDRPPPPEEQAPIASNPEVKRPR